MSRVKLILNYVVQQYDTKSSYNLFLSVAQPGFI